MNRVIVVVFNERSQACDGLDALKNLDREDALALHEYAIIQKQPDGTFVFIENNDKEGLRTLLGTSVGALIGLPGGPPAAAMGAVTGTLVGAAAEIDNSLTTYIFLDTLSEELTPGKFALIVVLDEEWTKWVDLRMQELGGVMYRYTLSEVKSIGQSADFAQMKADLALLKAELAQAKADSKATLHEKINRLDARIKRQIEKAEETRAVAESEADAKAGLLRQEAGEIRKESEEKEERLSLHEYRSA
jgi:uncharacterized membrane protein